MSVNLILFIILLGLLWYFQKNKGIVTIITLGINLALLFFMIVLINLGFSPIILTYLVSLMISANNLFNINGVNLSSKTAFKSSTLVITLMLLPIFYTISNFHIQGLPMEGLMEMDMYSLNIGISFVDLSVSVLLMVITGAINDIAISITAAMVEIKQQSPSISSQHWRKSGLVVGRDVLGSTINTLLFAAIGSQLALFVWLFDLNYSLEQMLNNKLLVQEIISVLLSAFSITLTVPLTIWVFLKTKKNAQEM